MSPDRAPRERRFVKSEHIQTPGDLYLAAAYFSGNPDAERLFVEKGIILITDEMMESLSDYRPQSQVL